MRSVCFRICFAVVDACHAAMELFRLGARLFTALAWGVANRSDLSRSVERRWDGERLLADELVVFRGLYPWEVQVYDRHLPNGGTLGLIGCGAGRDLIGLIRRGHPTVGMDISAEMIQKARGYLASAGIDATVFAGDIHDVDFPGGVYDAFIFSCFTYGLTPGSMRRVETLRRLRQRLAPAGVIVIFYLLAQSAREGWMIRLARAIAHGTNNPNQPEAGDEFTRFHDFEHRFTVAEITREAELAGYGIGEMTRLDENAMAAILRPSNAAAPAGGPTGR